MEYYGTAHCMVQRLDPADRTSISMSAKHVKARIVDATQGSVVFALDDINSRKTVEYAMSYADACRFSGRLLNQADYHSRHNHRPVALSPDMGQDSLMGMMNYLVDEGHLTPNQAYRLLMERAVREGNEGSPAHDDIRDRASRFLSERNRWQTYGTAD
jgi:hypothetical protein